AFGCSTALGFAEDAGIVDDRMHTPDLVDLIGEAARLRGAREVADDDAGGARSEILQRRGPFLRAGVKDDLVPRIDERGGGIASEPVRGTGDEDAAHGGVLVSRGTGECG